MVKPKPTRWSRVINTCGWNHGIKCHCMSANHMKMCVTQGYLNSNQTAMSEVMGPDYSWRLDVFKRLRMPVGPVVQEAERKRVAERERTHKRKEHDRKMGKKAHGKYEAHHRQQQRKQNSVIMHERIPGDAEIKFETQRQVQKQKSNRGRHHRCRLR